MMISIVFINIVIVKDNHDDDYDDIH